MLYAAILGFGTVGSGVAEVLTMNKELLAKKAGQSIELKYILDTRDFPGNPFEDKIIHDFALIENDPDVSLVAECIGGATIAFEFVKRCLQAGKHVATSNKELVATKGHELLEIAKAKNVNFFFEASVGGGIPVLRPLYFDLAGNEISEVAGIVNGTTNYILTKMLGEGAAFADVLKDAQAKGYAEANPAADVEGLDACRKACILSALSFGFHVYPDVFNGLLVRANAVGEAMFYGPGAGKLPTASAVVGDLVDAAWHLQARRDLDWADADPAAMADVRDVALPYVIRTEAPQAEVEAAFGPVTALDAKGYLLGKPLSRKAIEAAGLELLAVRPVFQ